MSNSPQDKTTGSNKSERQVQFKSSKIGHWAHRQEDPFAAQNRKRQAKKQANDQKREKATPFVVLFGGAAVIGVALWGLVMLIVSLINGSIIDAPEIAGGSMDDIANYSQVLQDFFNQHVGTPAEQLADVDKLVQNTLKTPNGKKYSNEVKLAQGMFYFDNELYFEAIDTLESINVDSISDLATKYNIYNTLCNAYQEMGDEEKSNDYFQKAYEVRIEAGGGGSAE